MRNILPALAAGALLLASAPAAAHTQLDSSVPADGAALSSAPDEIVLAFSAPVRLTAVLVRAADGIEHEIRPLPRERAEQFTLAAPELGPGRYRVDWRALSEDTHVVDGELEFTIGAGALD